MMLVSGPRGSLGGSQYTAILVSESDFASNFDGEEGTREDKENSQY